MENIKTLNTKEKGTLFINTTDPDDWDEPLSTIVQLYCDKPVKVVYTGSPTDYMDDYILKEMEKAGYEYTGMGYNFLSETRDISFIKRKRKKGKTNEKSLRGKQVRT